MAGVSRNGHSVKRDWLKGGVILAAFLLVPFSTPSFAFDNDAAKQSFKLCSTCHAIGPNIKKKLGPHLNGLKDRPYGAIEGFRYSKGMIKAREGGEVWSAANLDLFLKKPKAHIKGTRMNFPGIKDDEDRHNLIAWLNHFDANGNEISQKADLAGTKKTLLGQTASSLTGDVEYGQYLAGECTTCHQATGGDDGIPEIIGWPKETFIHALYEYKQEVRANPVMRTLTKRLGDEEMAALAAYFGSLEKE
ncbi:MAG: c-type cytochrome [Pseudomonadota bacterium]